HWLLHLASFPTGENRVDTHDGFDDVDPQRGWLALHTNICEFLASVPEGQKLRMRGEDVLTDRTRRLTEIAAWLGVRTDPEALEEMMHPERSPYACLGPPGARFGNDRSFLYQPALRPERAERHRLQGPLSWCKDGRSFLPAVEDLARQFGYE